MLGDVGGALRVGTSGFAFPQWKGHFYPAGLRDREMLTYYAGRFDTVEINYTFRRVPEEKTLVTWRDTTPVGFVFALKANQLITHFARLGDVQGAREFLELAATLGERLGPVLFQCPPNLLFERDRLEAFLEGLPEGGRYAFEFRHPSWEEAKGLLAEHSATWCIAETDDAPAPTDALAGTPRFAYVRLRRTAYDDQDLRSWAARIAAARAAGTDVFCYFKHEEAAGPRFAERLIELASREVR
jgi:uncharacterized protein YecE (DUF72 family)